MPDVELLLRDARPSWPEPPDALETRILGAIGPPARNSSRRSRLGRAARSRRLRLLAVGVLVAGSGAALAVAIAQRSGANDPGNPASLSFGEPQRVARLGGYLPSAPALAVDRVGTTSVAWIRAGRVVLSSRPHAGTWSSESALSGRDARASQPRLAASPQGLVAIWRERAAGRPVAERFTLPGGRSGGTLTTHPDVRWRIAMSERDGAGRWSAPVGITPAFGGLRDAYDPVLAAPGVGRALVGYSAAGRVWIVRQVGPTTWERPRALFSGPGTAASLTLAVAPRSAWAIATWLSYSDDPVLGRRWRVWAARRTPAGAWEAAVALGAPATGKPMGDAAINDQGEAVVGWTNGATEAATHDRSGAWSTASRLAPSRGPGFSLDAPSVGIDSQGRALVALSGPAGAEIARKEPGSGWRQPTLVRPDGRVAAVTPDTSGGLLIASVATHGGAVRVRSLGPGGRVRGTVSLRALGSSVDVAVGADGTTAVLGTASLPGATDIEAAVADARGHR